MQQVMRDITARESIQILWESVVHNNVKIAQVPRNMCYMNYIVIIDHMKRCSLTLKRSYKLPECTQFKSKVFERVKSRIKPCEKSA